MHVCDRADPAHITVIKQTVPDGRPRPSLSAERSVAIADGGRLEGDVTPFTDAPVTETPGRVGT